MYKKMDYIMVVFKVIQTFKQLKLRIRLYKSQETFLLFVFKKYRTTKVFQSDSSERILLTET